VRQQWLLPGIAFAVALASLPMRAAAPQAGPPPDLVYSLWEQPASGTLAIGIAPDGSCVAAIDRAGLVRCYSETGTLVWTANARGAERVMLATGGRRLAAYSAGAPLRTTIDVFDSVGKRIAVVDGEAPISAASLSADGNALALAAGNRLLLFRWNHGVERRMEVPAPHRVSQLAFASASSLYVAGQEPAALYRFRASGSLLWRARTEADRAPVLSTTPDGRLVATAAAREGPDPGIRLELRDAGGSLLWGTDWRGRVPRLRVVGNGSAILLSYEQPESHVAAIRYEHRLAYFRTDRPGACIWATGGAYTGDSFFAAAASDGSFAVSLDLDHRAGTTSLRLLGPQGDRRGSYTSSSAIRIAIASEDGTRIALYRADGMIALVAVQRRDVART
jgi:hypothetical protein